MWGGHTGFQLATSIHSDGQVFFSPCDLTISCCLPEHVTPPLTTHTRSSSILLSFSHIACRGHIASWLTSLVFLFLGFTKRTTDCGLHFWVREPRAAAPHASSSPSPPLEDDDEEALVFVHGLGFGNTPYLGFIHLLSRSFANKRMVVVELRHLAIQLSATVPTVEVLVSAAGPLGRAKSTLALVFAV